MLYKDYLNSEHWKSIKNKKHAANYRGKAHHCAVCEDTSRLEVHHLTYKNIGKESLKTLRLLCTECHKILHSLPKPKGYGRIVKKWLAQRKKVIKIRNLAILR